MPFETGILDNFTGSDETPITTNWDGPIFPALDQFRRLSNQLAAPAGSFGGSWFDVATYGPDCEFYITISAKFGVADAALFFFARTLNAGTASLDGYALEFAERAGTDEIGLHRVDDGIATGIGLGLIEQEVSVGDKIGIRCIDDSIQNWYWSSGPGWTMLDEATDATYSSAGNVGFSGTNGALRLDDLGGGTVVPSTAAIFYVGAT